jgi:hypothetical protein
MSSFQLLPYYSKFTNTVPLYGQAHVEYNMQGLLTNKLPLLRQLKWYFILGTNTFYAGKQNYYSEGFVSISNIGYKQFRFLRVDFVHGWENGGHTHTGIRIGIRPIMIGSLSLPKDKNGEW